jgi:hypothetical protein
MRPQQAAGIQVGEQMLHGHQGVDFGGRKPEARQFVLRADVGLSLAAAQVAITACFAVPDDRCVEAVAQVFQVAFQGRARDFQPRLNACKRRRLGRGQHHVDQMKTLGSVHVFFSKVARGHCSRGFTP